MGGEHDEPDAKDASGAQRSAQSVNYGISGVGSINAGNLAVGSNSRIEVSVDRSLLAGQLDALAKALAAFEGPQEKREELIAAHHEIAEELHSSNPDKHRLLSTLAAIASAAGSTGAIVRAAETLAGAIQHLL
jgi:hypothetical protein